MFFDIYSEVSGDTIDGPRKENIQKLFDSIEETRNNGKRLFVLGNGGSAAAVSYRVCDFGKGVSRRDSKRLRTFSPADSGAIFSALGDGCGYGTTLVEQMKSSLELGNLVPIFSVSGSSSNPVEAHRYAKEIGVKTACVVADRSGRIIGMSDFAMVIPPENYGIVEGTHVILGHAISQQIYADNVGA